MTPVRTEPIKIVDNKPCRKFLGGRGRGGEEKELLLSG